MTDLDAGAIVAGRYRIRSALGRGAYGAVYLVARVDSETPLALKLMHQQLSEGDVGRRRFEREAEMLRDLRHPNVVQLLDFGTTEDELPFIAFELLTGRTLRQELARHGPLSLPMGIRMTRQVLSALSAAHAAGVVHRDIKPENIFLCDSPPDMVKVLDFGIAKATAFDHRTALTATGQMVGTPRYMPPEQVRGEAVDERSDIYAVGNVLAEAVTGQKLVPGSTAIDMFMHHLSADPLVIPDSLLGTALGDVVCMAVAKSPAQRFSTAAAMSASLEALATGADREPLAPIDTYDPFAEPSAMSSVGETATRFDLPTTTAVLPPTAPRQPLSQLPSEQPHPVSLQPASPQPVSPQSASPQSASPQSASPHPVTPQPASLQPASLQPASQQQPTSLQAMSRPPASQQPASQLVPPLPSPAAAPPAMATKPLLAGGQLVVLIALLGVLLMTGGIAVGLLLGRQSASGEDGSETTGTPQEKSKTRSDPSTRTEACDVKHRAVRKRLTQDGFTVYDETKAPLKNGFAFSTFHIRRPPDVEGNVVVTCTTSKATLDHYRDNAPPAPTVQVVKRNTVIMVTLVRGDAQPVADSIAALID